MDHIGKIEITFTMNKDYSEKEHRWLKFAAETHPIKHIFHPQTEISVCCNYPK